MSPMVDATSGAATTTWRSLSPAQTVNRMTPYLPALGVTRVADVTGLDGVGIPLVMVVRPNSRSLSITQGKGVTLDAARASGIMEAVEQHHAETARSVEVATLDSLHADDVIDVQRLPRFLRELQRNERIPWVRGHDLERCPIWVPFEMVHLDLRLPLPPGSGCFLAGSNGLASGNDELEAVLHGAYEVVERDALTLFYRTDGPAQWQRRICLSTIDDPTCAELLQRYDRARVSVAVWDVTSDVGVATFLCAIIDRDPNPFRPLGEARGSGAHADRGVALARALTEAAQSRMTHIVGCRDDLATTALQENRDPKAIALSRARIAMAEQPPRSFRDVSHQTHGVGAAIEALKARLAQVGVGPIAVVDLSRPEYPAWVVRVIVPGLEAFNQMPGYQPGPRAMRLGLACA